MLEQLTIEFIAFTLVGIIGVVGLISWSAVKKAAKSALSSKNISPSRPTSGIVLPQSTDLPRPPPNNAASKANYAKALEEIETGAIDKGTWALALSESMGKEPEARAHYIRFRVAELNHLVERQIEHYALAETKSRQHAERQKQERMLQNIYDCPCGFSGKAKIKSRGNILTAMFLLCLYILPGLIYIIIFSGYKAVCPNCGHLFAGRVKP